jgi:hypothetical protein
MIERIQIDGRWASVVDFGGWKKVFFDGGGPVVFASPSHDPRLDPASASALDDAADALQQRLDALDDK